MLESPGVFSIATESVDRFALVWSLIMEALRDDLHAAEIDAYPEWRILPHTASDGLDTLREWAKLHRGTGRDPLMALEVALENEALFEAVKAFGPYSISAKIFDSRGSLVLKNEDGGTGFAYFTSAQRRRVVGELDRFGFVSEECLVPFISGSHGRETNL